MVKNKIRPSAYVYPMPTTIVGTTVKGKPTFVTISFCGNLQYKPPMLVISCGKHHYTTEGIKENQTFSVNIPSTKMVKVTDFIGITSGRTTDKSQVFDVFYGELENAPMISEAPLNQECKVVKIIDLGGHNDIIIGEIVQTYVNEECLTNRKPDIEKIDPIIFSGYSHYLKIGEVIAEAYKIGKEYKIE